MNKVRFGVLGVAKIAVEKVIPAMRAATHCEVVALASRELAKARHAAERLGLDRAHGSYEELLADPDVDAIYNPLPNHLHVPWSIRALDASKHVLCEKPLAATAAEAEQLVIAGKRHPELKLMEAFMYRHHPQWVKARQLARDGTIGELRAIQSFFSYFNRDPTNVRNQAEIGGGGLLDIGCYCVSLSRFVFGFEPARVAASVEHDPDFKVDRLTGAILDFSGPPEGAAPRPVGISSFVCGTQLAPFQRVQLVGTSGRVEIEIPFNAPPDRSCRMWHQRASTTTEIVIPTCDQYTIQADLFSRAILDDTPVPTPITDGVANLRVIEAVMRAGKSGKWESC